MKWLVAVLISFSLFLPFGTSLADQTTAPGQQKKAAGDGSAKEYAPGQDKDAEAAAKESKRGDAKTKGEKAADDKGKASATEKTTGAPMQGSKAKKK